MKIYVRKKIYNHRKLSEKAIAAYVALRKIYRPDVSEYYISTIQIIYLLTNSTDIKVYDRYFKADILQGLQELIDNDIIVLISHIEKHNYILDLSNLGFKHSDSFFSLVDDSDIFKIMKCEANKFKLLFYYINLIGTILNADKTNTYNELEVKDVGYMPQSFFIENLNLSQKSIYTYNKILEEQEIIYFYKPNVCKNTYGKVTTFSGTYGRFENKDIIQSAGEEMLAIFSGAKKPLDPRIRSLISMYRFVKDEGKVYHYDKMKEIYFCMYERNQDIKNNYNLEFYEENKRDLSMFKDYEYYIDEDVDVNSS